MGESQAELPNTGMRSAGNTGKGLELIWDIPKGVLIRIFPQNIGNGLWIGRSGGNTDKESVWGGLIPWILVGSCVDPDRIHHSKKYRMHGAALHPKQTAGKKKMEPKYSTTNKALDYSHLIPGVIKPKPLEFPCTPVADAGMQQEKDPSFCQEIKAGLGNTCFPALNNSKLSLLRKRFLVLR